MSEVAERVLALLGEIHGAADMTEFKQRLLIALRRELPSDYVSLNEIGEGPHAVTAIIEPDVPAMYHARFAELAEQNPLVARLRRTGDGRPYRFSDVVSPEQLRATRLYQEVYRPLGVEHQIAFALPAPRGRLLGVALSRSEADFSELERRVLARVRPFLIESYRSAVAHRHAHTRVQRLTSALRGAGLTARQAQAMTLVAHGRSSAEIAVAMGVSPRTVEKHLQLAFARLRVCGRSAAAQRAWDLADGAAGD